MKILTSLAISLTLVACASGPEPAKVDVFTDIAKGWQGAQIKEMIEVWGDPKILNQASSSGGDGTATWTHFAGAWPAGISGAARRMRCEATASFNSQGTITAVDVVSQYCRPDRRSNMEDLRRM